MDRRHFIASGLCTCALPAQGIAQTFTLSGREYETRQAFDNRGLRCGTPLPSLYEQRRGERAVTALRGRNIAIEPIIKVPLRFNVIHNGDKGKLTKKHIDDQIAVLNKAFAASKYKFSLKELRYHNNARWFNVGHKSDVESDMKSGLVADPETCLNVYTGDLKGGLLGWATFPWELQFARAMDGVVLTHTSFPGNAEGPFNLGMTAVHEIGHWLGLFHTFQGGCQDPGDSITDTHPEGDPAFGCPAGRQSCQSAQTKDMIENYMDYSDDSCMTAFTSGQSRRMREMTGIFRTDIFQASLGRSFGPDGRVADVFKEIRDSTY